MAPEGRRLERSAWVRDLLRDGLQGVLLHKGRSVLSALGILFGVGAVIGILSIGEGARREQEMLIARMGILNFQILADYPDDEEEVDELKRISQGLSLRDVKALRDALPGADRVGGMKEIQVREIIPRPAESLQVIGAEPGWLAATTLRRVAGRGLRPEDEQRTGAVCLLGSDAERALFGGEPGLGRWVRLGEVWVKVVGIFEDPTVSTGVRVEGADMDDRSRAILIPLSTAMKRFEPDSEEPELTEIQVGMGAADQVLSHTLLASQVLDRLHREQPDYKLVIPLKLLEQSREQQRIFNIVMGLIAGISLLVGGIGIMNIMLASVLERTREIGVRLAVGATPRDIRLLFLAESALLSLTGGLLGIIAGYGIAAAVAATTGWATAVSPSAVALATAISTFEGILFGFIPARQASMLPPAIAVRSG